MTSLNYVSSSPHILSKDTTASIMKDVLIALVPATLVGFYVFGLPAIINVLLAICTAVGAEYIFQKLTKRRVTINDYSAAVTGLLLGLNIPAGTSYYVPIIGSIFAIIIVKQLFGGLGQNFMNPALAARAFLIVSYADYMTTWPAQRGIDSVTLATPLSYLKLADTSSVNLMDCFLGFVGGSIGEISALALILGGIYLIIKKVISFRIPLSYILSFSILILLFGKLPFNIEYLLMHLFTGGLMLGAFFMATDYSSSPISNIGQIIMGIGCGIITFVIRIYGGYPEGVSFAILIMNLCVPLIDKYTVPVSLGGSKK